LDRDVIKLAVVGAGYFGSFHCQKLAALPEVELSVVVDIDGERARAVGKQYGVEWLQSHLELIGEVDAAVVAVPTSQHYAVSTGLLDAGVSLLVEKPLAATNEQAQELCRLAAEREVALQVGHLERFNPVFVEALKHINQPKKIDMERSGPYPGRGGDVGVVLELMSHDLDILLQLTGSRVRRVTAFGESVCTPFLDRASAEIEFEDGLRASVKASRADSTRARRFRVADADGMLEANLAGSFVERIYSDNGHRSNERRMVARNDPLLDQDMAFVRGLLNGSRPAVGGEAGRAVVALAARIIDSMQNGGSS